MLHCDFIYPVNIFSMPVLDSRMYVMSPEAGELLIVDPVLLSEEDQPLFAGICRHARHATVLVTHSHYDHIAGINHVRESLDTTVYATALCDSKMAGSRKNLSSYSLSLVMGKDEEQERYCREHYDFDYVCRADEIYEGTLELALGNIVIRTVGTPGHSDCSQCIELRDHETSHLQAVFTGDSLVNGHEVITRFPTGNTDDYLAITKPYLDSLPDDILVLPGHGDPETLKNLS